MDVEHREVIIVGAGPAGTTCAQRLAEEGIDVLILERRAIVGNPAQCGECIPNWGEVVGTFHGLEDHHSVEIDTTPKAKMATSRKEMPSAN